MSYVVVRENKSIPFRKLINILVAYHVYRDHTGFDYSIILTRVTLESKRVERHALTVRDSQFVEFPLLTSQVVRIQCST